MASSIPWRSKSISQRAQIEIVAPVVLIYFPDFNRSKIILATFSPEKSILPK
jgi:hypothetical protein